MCMNESRENFRSTCMKDERERVCVYVEVRGRGGVIWCVDVWMCGGEGKRRGDMVCGCVEVGEEEG